MRQTMRTLLLAAAIAGLTGPLTAYAQPDTSRGVAVLSAHRPAQKFIGVLSAPRSSQPVKFIGPYPLHNGLLPNGLMPNPPTYG